MSAATARFWKIFEGFRRVVIFLLGCLVFLKGTFYPEYSIPELIVGMIMVGILPIERFFGWHLRHGNEDDPSHPTAGTR